MISSSKIAGEASQPSRPEKGTFGGLRGLEKRELEREIARERERGGEGGGGGGREGEREREGQRERESESHRSRGTVFRFGFQGSPAVRLRCGSVL